MREIKFRQPIFDSKGKFLKWHYWGFNVDGCRWVGPITDESVGKESQLFTGEKDRNCADVYEGDVLCIANHPKIRMIVSWKDCGLNVPANLLSGAGNPWVRMGNITENPELVK